jgi:hypothetical protein
MAVRRCVEDLCMTVHDCASGSCAEMCGGLVHGFAWLRMAARVGEEMFEDSGFPVGRKELGDRK